MRCELCGRKTDETIRIKNKKNGTELEICRKCKSHFGIKQKARKKK